MLLRRKETVGNNSASTAVSVYTNKQQKREMADGQDTICKLFRGVQRNCLGGYHQWLRSQNILRILRLNSKGFPMMRWNPVVMPSACCICMLITIILMLTAVRSQMFSKEMFMNGTHLMGYMVSMLTKMRIMTMLT